MHAAAQLLQSARQELGDCPAGVRNAAHIEQAAAVQARPAAPARSASFNVSSKAACGVCIQKTRDVHHVAADAVRRAAGSALIEKAQRLHGGSGGGGAEGGLLLAPGALQQLRKLILGHGDATGQSIKELR